MWFYRLFLLIPFYCTWAYGSAGWSTEEMTKNLQSRHAIRNFEKQKDCNDSPLLLSVVNIHKVLEKGSKNHKEKFVCDVRKEIDLNNQEIEANQKFMLNYIKAMKENPESLSTEDHLQMTEKMIKYRLLRNNKMKEYYVPSTRYTPPEEVLQKMKQMARKHFEKNGPPTSCFFVKEDRVKKSKLTESSCQKEITLKVQKIPNSLILAQAALESNWGKSSLAEEENNILGLQVAFRDPSSMDNYPNCRRAKRSFNRCLLKFNNYRGSIDEYFSRFNGSHLRGYQDYRSRRFKLYSQRKNYNECQQADVLHRHIDFYAENKMYTQEIQGVLSEVCSMSRKCSVGDIRVAKK